MRQRSGLQLSIITLLILIAELFSITGITIIPLGLVVLALSVVLLTRRIGWTLSLVGSLVTLLAVEVFLLRVLPLTKLDLATSHELVWGVVAVGLGAVITIRSIPLPRPSRLSVRTAIRASAGAIVAGIGVSAVAVISRSTVVSWSMNNDAAWTTFQAQHIAADRGINTAAHPNPSAFMSGLMAVVDSPGRSNLSSARWLESDIIRNGQLWVLVILGTSILVGLLASSVIGPDRPRFRTVATVLISVLPFSWYISGFSVLFGFYSASLAVFLLVCVWALWQCARAHPVWAFTFFALLATDLLATWAPLVLVPIALAAVLFFRNVRLFLRPASAARIIVSALAVAQLLAYGALVAIPDLRSNDGALAANGAIQHVPPKLFVVIAIAAIVITLIVGLQSRQFHDLVGLLAMEVAMAIATGVILLQGGAGWRYYPDKIAWLSTILLLVVIVCGFAQLLGQRAARRALVLAAAVVSVATIWITATVVPPLARGPLAVISLSTVYGSASHAPDVLAHRVLTLADPRHKRLLSHYSSLADDQYVNFWLIQLTAQGSVDPIRYYAYTFDSTNAKQVCGAIKTWHGHVDVLTTSASWGATLRGQCPNENFSVVVKR